MTSSGQSNFFLSNADVLIEAFDRIEVRPTAITGEMMISGRRSINLEMASWDSSVPLLWKIDSQPTMIPLQQGVATYNLPTDTVTMLDTYVRTFQLQTQFNVPANFTTVSGNTSVTAYIANNAMLPGYWFQIATPIAIGGIVLYGYYEVVNLINTNSFTFNVLTAPTTSVTNGGVLPLFITTSGQTTVQVTLTNHEYVAGESFNVAALTTVGGISLLGTYNISNIIDANNFVIQTYSTAGTSASVYENNNQLQVQAQASSADPIDRILTPIGRTDYAQFPDKFTQTVPTQYLLLRNINPTVTLYQVPDGNGPYVLMTYLMHRIQNANPSMGETPDVHYLALDALCAKLAARLAVKYAKSMLPVLKPLADEAWGNFLQENRERAEICLAPNLSPFYRI